jgi:DNA-binding response OmpR family regulator
VKTILLIEDDLFIRTLLLDVLETENFQAIGAENGHIGVQLAREHMPDLILCDVMMPLMNGYEVLSKLREDPVTASIPFIFLTAKTDSPDRCKSMQLGADAYLIKPFSSSELLGAIDKWLSLGTSSPASPEGETL